MVSLVSRNAESMEIYSPEDRAIVEAQLFEQVMDTVVSPLHRAGFAEVKRVGFAPCFNGPVVTEGQLNDWVIMRAEQDPLIQSDRFYVPNSNLQRMKAMVPYLPNAGKDLVVYTAHEIVRGHAQTIRETNRVPIQLVEPVPPIQIEPLGKHLGATSSQMMTWGRRLLVVGAILLPIAATIAVHAATAALVLDPVIFLAATRSGKGYVGEPAYFVSVAQWDLPVRGS